MRTDELDFFLPPELIAQDPAPYRAASRLLHYSRATKSIAHRIFSDLPRLLKSGDLLVFNDAQVIPARFMLQKATGGKVEGLFLAEPTLGRWHVMLRNLGDAAVGTELRFVADGSLSAKLIERLGDGEYVLEVLSPSPGTPGEGRGEGDLVGRESLGFRNHPHPNPLPEYRERGQEILSRIGRMPLPPYIKRDKQRDPRDDNDRQRYQTVYAKNPGAIAAPTAGLHFTPELLDQLDAIGIERAMVTLNVGVGTFKPVSADTLEAHQMHTESYSVSAETAEMLNRAQEERRRIIAVGTTSARVLESHPAGESWTKTTGSTSIFIYPPYLWKHVAAMITNFHLPRSTLIALVAAMVGLDEQRRIYAEAIESKYRFFSYGDAMLIE